MFMMITTAITVILFSTILLMLALLINSRFTFSNNKNSSFECGFDPKESARSPFSLRFFLLAVIFLVFDIEIALLFPLILLEKSGASMQTMSSGIFFYLILLVGLFHEWNEGSLNWVK